MSHKNNPLHFMKSVLPKYRIGAAFFCLVLFLVSQGIAGEPGDREISLINPSDDISEFIIGDDIPLLAGTGPFEVSGEPSSYAVAWIDTIATSEAVESDESRSAPKGSDRKVDRSPDQKMLRKNILSIVLLEGGKITYIKQISNDVDVREKIFLKKNNSANGVTALCWKESDGWHISVLERTVSIEGNSEPTYSYREKLLGMRQHGMLSLCIKEDRAAVLMNAGNQENAVALMDAGVERTFGNGTQDKNMNQEAADRVHSGYDRPSLFEIDLKSLNARLLYEFSEKIRSASLSYRDGSRTVAAVESVSANLQYLEVDPGESIPVFRLLNNFPVIEVSPILKETGQNSFIGWIEKRAEREVAFLGVVNRAGSGILIMRKEISSLESSVEDIFLAEGSEVWVAVSEDVEGKKQLSVTMLDIEGKPSCASVIGGDTGIERFWLLADKSEALLFKQILSVDGKRSLAVQSLSCEVSSESVATADKRIQDILSIDKSIQEEGMTAHEALTGREEEVCDGYDNDSDGTVDEGCDQICDNPEKIGSDVRVTYNSSFTYRPSLVWSGSEYGVSWQDHRNGNDEVYFARLDSSGTKIGSDMRVTNDAAYSYYPSLVWSGSEYAVSWYDSRDGNDEIYFTRLSSSGSKIGSDVRVTNDGSSSQYPSVAWSGSEHGISWQDYRDGNWEIYFARLDSSGSKIGSDVRVTNNAAYSYYPSLIWNGSNYGISWQDYRDGNDEIYFARLDSSGIKIGSDVRVTNAGSYSQIPSLLWNESEYGVSWYDARDGDYEIYFARLDSSGTKIGSDVRVTNNVSASYAPSLVWSGSEYGVAWRDDRDGNWEIYFARLDSSGTKIGSNVRVTNDASPSNVGSLVWNGGDYGISWHDSRDGNYEIYFALISCCDDVDMDTYTECHECDDSDATVYPGASELCDAKDNDCDGTIDEGFATPGATTELAFLSMNKTTFNWTAVSPCTGYDTVKGDLDQLRITRGDFSTTITGCLEDSGSDTQSTDSSDPSGNGEGFYYLVRAQNCLNYGSYNTGDPSQIGDRDAEIDASSNKCP